MVTRLLDLVEFFLEVFVRHILILDGFFVGAVWCGVAQDNCPVDRGKGSEFGHVVMTNVAVHPT